MEFQLVCQISYLYAMRQLVSYLLIFCTHPFCLYNSF